MTFTFSIWDPLDLEVVAVLGEDVGEDGAESRGDCAVPQEVVEQPGPNQRVWCHLCRGATETCQSLSSRLTTA